jgi:hypothetical protein
MQKDPIAALPEISKSQVLQDYCTLERTKEMAGDTSRSPTMALRLALSKFGGCPREGYLPLSFFSENDIQVYIGLPSHPLNRLLKITGATTSTGIVNKVFPDHRNSQLSFEMKYRYLDGLPTELQNWFRDVQEIVRKILQENWDPPPIHVMNFKYGKQLPWIVRGEHLCGQVADGTHRVIAYTLLSQELPELCIPVRLLRIHTSALALLNSLTLALRFFMEPLSTRNFIKKRFENSAFFVPTVNPKEEMADNSL